MSAVTEGRPELDLDRARLEAVDPVECEGHQLETVGGGSDHSTPLLPGISGHHEEHPVETQRGQDLVGGDDVGGVHGIEGAAEHSDPLLLGARHRPSLRAGTTRSGLHHTETLPSRRARRLTLMTEPRPGPAHVLVRVWLPDRPGALGLVASRIGAMRGDIIGVDVLERGLDVAVDEFAVELPDIDLLNLMVKEVEEVDGASVEEVRIVAAFPDPRLDALEFRRRPL